MLKKNTLLIIALLFISCKTSLKKGKKDNKDISGNTVYHLNLQSYDCQDQCEVNSEEFDFIKDKDVVGRKILASPLYSDEQTMQMIKFNAKIAEISSDLKLIDKEKEVGISAICSEYIEQNNYEYLVIFPPSVLMDKNFEILYFSNILSAGVICTDNNSRVQQIISYVGNNLESYLNQLGTLKKQALSLSGNKRFLSQTEPSSGIKILRTNSFNSRHISDESAKTKYLNSPLDPEMLMKNELSFLVSNKRYQDLVYPSGALRMDGFKKIAEQFFSANKNLEETYNYKVLGYQDFKDQTANPNFSSFLDEKKVNAFFIQSDTDAHFSFIYLDKNKEKVFISDSIGLNNAALKDKYDVIAKNLNDRGYQVLAHSSPRQRDIINCSFFCLRDAYALSNQNLFDSVTSMPVQKVGNINFVSSVPAEILNTAQSMAMIKQHQEVGKFVINNKLNQNIEETKIKFYNEFIKEIDNNLEALSKKFQNFSAEESKTYNDLSLKRNILLGYQASLETFLKNELTNFIYFYPIKTEIIKSANGKEINIEIQKARKDLMINLFNHAIKENDVGPSRFSEQ